MLSPTPQAAVAAPARRLGRAPAKVGGSALRASLGARLVVAAVLSAVMWVAVSLVVHL